MNFEDVVVHDAMHETMDDEATFEEEMEDCPILEGIDFGMPSPLVLGADRKVLVKKERYVEPDYPRLPSEGNLEWQYTMRRTMQEIIPGLFLGPYASATRAKQEEMKAAGLTHIVCVRQNLERNLIRPNHPDHFKYLVVEIADSATENIIPHFKVVNSFLDESLSGGGKVLVHGNAGISRSAALVIAYIMSKFGVTLKEAFSFVQSKRFCCNPNEGFMAQLREYEPIYRALHTVPLPLPGVNPNRASMKRGLDPEDAEANAAAPPPVMDNRQFDSGHTSQSASSESSMSSSSESLPQVGASQFPPSNQPTDTPMSIS
ncbi:unnamed protein product [Orchesella dallaii]|uniref:Serine/threonine/tyrosine-interacting protein n=1 Tax=Orchesella dallaii TaxID=48710 RepID=A0ABP1R5F0_9HEXA